MPLGHNNSQLYDSKALFCGKVMSTSLSAWDCQIKAIILSKPKGLVTNYGEGGATKREGGAREVLPLRKGGAEKVLAMLKGGHNKFWGSFYTVA